MGSKKKKKRWGRAEHIRSFKREKKKEGHWEMMHPDVQNWHVFNSTKQLEAVDKEWNVEEFRLLSIILVNLLQRILYATFVCGQISQISFNFFKDYLPMRNTKIHCIHCLFIVTKTQSLPPILTYKLAMMILEITFVLAQWPSFCHRGSKYFWRKDNILWSDMLHLHQLGLQLLTVLLELHVTDDYVV